jgi:ABC-2 type transport system ATP-binding protein
VSAMARVDGRETAIAVSRLRKVYGSHAALHELSRTVAQGEVFGFLGPNGAGKTTAVKLITGLARPTSGDGTVLGRPLGDRLARRELGYLPELFRFQEWLSATELLEMHGELAGMPRTERRRRAAELLELVGLAGRARDRVGTFSKGMQQRIGLAQALMARPRLVILDEPTSALDPLGRRDVRNIIQELRRRGVTVFLNSHLLSEVELVCDRVAFVNRGRVVREGRVHDLVADRTELLIRVEGVTNALLRELQTRWQVIDEKASGPSDPEGEQDSPTETVIRLAVPRPAEAGKVARLVVGHGACLLELVPQRSSLEQLFLELVEGPALSQVEGGADGRVDVRPPEPTRSGS